MIAQLSGAYLRAKPGKIIPRLISYLFYEGRPATTRGRWFNPITFKTLHAAGNHVHLPGAESPLFITGTGRSGSTILGLVLSLHNETGFLNEPKALWYVANPVDDLIGSYSNAEAQYIMDGNATTDEISHKVKSMYSSFMARSGCRRIVDKFPEMIFRIGYLEKIFSEAKYIFLYRNPWDTIASTAAWSVGHYNAVRKENWWGVNNRKWKLLLEQVVTQDPMLAAHSKIISNLDSEYDKAAVEWITTMNQGLKMHAIYPGKILMVKYESLCRNPENILGEISTFSGLEHDETMLRFGSKVLTLPSNGMAPAINPLLEGFVQQLSETLGYSAHSLSASVTE